MGNKNKAENSKRAINYSSGRGQIQLTGHSEDYKVFLLYIINFNTNLGRICFYFSGVLGGVTIVLGESSTFVACLHKQIPFDSFLYDVRKQPLMTP